MRLPRFPEFSELRLEYYKIFKEFTNKFPPYSDYNFVSLWSYNVENDALVSEINGNIAIRFRDYVTNEPFYSFFGVNNVYETAQNLIELSIDQNVSPSLKLIPETVIDRLNSDSKFVIKEDRDNFDYIYQFKDMSELKGKSYSKKRNKKHVFLNTNQSLAEWKDITEKTVQKQILDLFDTWAKGKEDTDHERKAVVKLLDVANTLKLLCLGVYVDSKLVAFTIVEPLPKDFVIVHFSKAERSYTGIFEFLYFKLATDLYKKGYRFFNREQDLGIEGLRKAKMSWRPTKFLKKYIISSSK